MVFRSLGEELPPSMARYFLRPDGISGHVDIIWGVASGCGAVTVRLPARGQFQPDLSLGAVHFSKVMPAHKSFKGRLPDENMTALFDARYRALFCVARKAMIRQVCF